MTVKGGTTPTCAACKYQWRKCSPTCPLAPYFPANQPKIFQNVHRLFGVKNVTNTIQNLKTKDQREDAMRSIIYEADMRERFPVDGCLAVIAQLRHKLDLAYEELHFVCANLDACREQQMIAGNRPQYGEGLDVARPLLTLDMFADTMSNNSSSIQAQMDAFGIQAQQFHNASVFDDRQSYNIEAKSEARDGFEASTESLLEDAAAAGER